VAFLSQKDFSFLGALLRWSGVGALVVIVTGGLFGFQLGTWFSVGMIIFAGAAILYDTSNVLRSYPEDRHVAVSLQLFASVMLLFWYVIRLFLSRKYAERSRSAQSRARAGHPGEPGAAHSWVNRSSSLISPSARPPMTSSFSKRWLAPQRTR
jgi:hypothetical protein